MKDNIVLIGMPGSGKRLTDTEGRKKIAERNYRQGRPGGIPEN